MKIFDGEKSFLLQILKYQSPSSLGDYGDWISLLELDSNNK